MNSGGYQKGVKNKQYDGLNTQINKQNAAVGSRYIMKYKSHNWKLTDLYNSLSVHSYSFALQLVLWSNVKGLTMCVHYWWDK